MTKNYVLRMSDEEVNSIPPKAMSRDVIVELVQGLIKKANFLEPKKERKRVT